MTANPILSTRPVYLQIRDILALRISEKRWERNQPIPSESDLAGHFKVSVATIRKALAIMEKEGLVYRKQGLGTFVTDRLSESYRAKYDRVRRPDGSRFDWLFAELKTKKSTASQEAAIALDIQPGDEIFEVYRVRKTENNIFMVEFALVSAALCPNLDSSDDHCRGIVSIADTYGLLLDTYIQTLQIVPAPDHVATTVRYEPGQTIWKLLRTVRDFEGRIVEFRTCYVTPHNCAYLDES